MLEDPLLGVGTVVKAQGQDLLPSKILALQESLGRLAFNWRGHHYWSRQQNPMNEEWGRCFNCDGRGTYILSNWREISCPECKGKGHAPTGRNPLLEAYTDCLSLLLSIGLDVKVYKDQTNREWAVYKFSPGTVLSDMFDNAAILDNMIRDGKKHHIIVDHWYKALQDMDCLARSLDLAQAEVSEAFDARINERQAEYGCSPTSA